MPRPDLTVADAGLYLIFIPLFVAVTGLAVKVANLLLYVWAGTAYPSSPLLCLYASFLRPRSFGF